MKVYSSKERYDSNYINIVNLDINILTEQKRYCLKKGGLINFENMWYCLEITPFNQSKPKPRKRTKKRIKKQETFYDMIDRKTNELLEKIKEI